MGTLHGKIGALHLVDETSVSSDIHMIPTATPHCLQPPTHRTVSGNNFLNVKRLRRDSRGSFYVLIFETPDFDFKMRTLPDVGRQSRWRPAKPDMEIGFERKVIRRSDCNGSPTFYTMHDLTISLRTLIVRRSPTSEL